MFHLCMFSGQGGELEPGRQFYLTMFGGAEYKRPTLARQVLRNRHEMGTQRNYAFFFTIFGGVSIQSPCLAEEYSELLTAMRGGKIGIEEADRFLAEDRGALRTGGITLFGGADMAELPSEDDEIEALAVLRHSGALSPGAEQTLIMGIGRSGAQRLSMVRQAVLQAQA